MNKKHKKILKKVWWFIWEDNSVWSWMVNIVLAFVLIKFIVYPGLGLILGTNYPIVAVVSESMEHRAVPKCIKYETSKIFDDVEHCIKKEYIMCGKTFEEKRFFNLDGYWNECGIWYESETKITKNDFSGFMFKNGFYKGDIMVLIGSKAESLKIGDVVVFKSDKPDPIIHRIVKKWRENGKYFFQTKGDNNKDSIEGSLVDETKISEDMIIGKAVLKVPLLGYIKIVFVESLKFIGIMK